LCGIIHTQGNARQQGEVRQLSFRFILALVDVTEMSALKVLTEPMKKAIARSGYLMEQRLVPVIERFGFKATPNERFRDPETGELRELDISAISAERIGQHGYDFIFPLLLIACKNLTCPLVFFAQQELRLQWFLGKLQISGLPLEIVRNGRFPKPITEFLKLEGFHHYYRTGHVASQFCAVYEDERESKKAKSPVFQTGHTIGGRISLFNDFDALAKAVLSNKREHGHSFRLDRRGEKVNLQVYYPIFVTSGPLVECYVGGHRPRYRRVHRIGFLLRTHLSAKQREFRIDVVDEQGLRRLLSTINKETAKIAQRFRKQRKVTNDSLDWITQRLSRRKRDYQLSYVSGEEESR
jgi:hypothetical protein